MNTMSQAQTLYEPTGRQMSPSFVAMIISGVGLYVGLLGHIVSISLPIWFDGRQGYRGLFSSPRTGYGYDMYDTATPGWVEGLRAMEMLGLMLAIAAGVLFVVIVVRSSSIRSTQPLNLGEKIAVLGFVACMFFASVFIFLGLIITVTIGRTDPPWTIIGPYISGIWAVSFLMATGLAGKGAVDIIIYRK